MLSRGSFQPGEVVVRRLSSYRLVSRGFHLPAIRSCACQAKRSRAQRLKPSSSLDSRKQLVRLEVFAVAHQGSRFVAFRAATVLAVLLFVFRVLILILILRAGSRLAVLSSVEARLLAVEQEGWTEVPGDPGPRHVRIQRHVRKNARGRQYRLLQEVSLWQEGVNQSELLHGEDLDVGWRRLLQLQRQPLVALGLGPDQQLRVPEGSAVGSSILTRC